MLVYSVCIETIGGVRREDPFEEIKLFSDRLAVSRFFSSEIHRNNTIISASGTFMKGRLLRLLNGNRYL